MSSAIVTDTDEEMAKYDEARLLAENHPPLAAMKNKKTAYNTETGKTEILMTLEGGGYVKVGEEPKDRTREIQSYSKDLQSMGQPFDIKNFTSAGYTEDEVMAAGVMPQGQEKTGRTEPLTPGEELLILRSGGSIAKPRELTRRERDRKFFVENSEGELRQIFEVLGMDYGEARRLAEGIFGNPNSTRGDLGLGIADFTPLGLFYGSEEGVQTYQRGRNSGDNVMAAMGALEAGLSFAEAVPVTAAAAKGIKKNIPALRAGIEELGKRLNQPGEMPVAKSVKNNEILTDMINEKQPDQVLVKIPIEDVEHGESALPGGKLTFPEAQILIQEYANKKTPLPPIEIYDLEDSNGKAFIGDGSHRFEAAKLRGDKFINAYVFKDNLPNLPNAKIVEPDK